jgi:NitT/TauT family transport system permease protein
MEFREPLKNKKTYELMGIGATLALLQAIAMLIHDTHIFPYPVEIVQAIPRLHFEDFLIRNLGYSLYLNFASYIIALSIAIPLGFLLGLYTPLGTMFNRQIDAIRYVPLTALVGLFVVWFGMYSNMKIQFLAAGIFVYLLPQLITRINEVDVVYHQTIRTLGASKWQQFRHVFWPAVMSKFTDDIRVLTPISWTYICVIELINVQGGIGAMIWKVSRAQQMDRAFATLAVIILVGILQDKLFLFSDRKIWKFKYVQKGK